MNSTSLEDEHENDRLKVALGNEAARIMSDPHIVEAFEAIDKRYVDMLVKAVQYEDIMMAKYLMISLKEFKSHFEKAIFSRDKINISKEFDTSFAELLTAEGKVNFQ